MRQVLLKEGRAVIEDVPAPQAGPGRLLVRTAFSVLSAGTERAALHAGGAATILDRIGDPSTLRRALDVLTTEGPGAIVDRIRKSREPHVVAPGYAASGLVQAAGPGVLDLPPGTAVACAGAGIASHAEWIAVPRMLVVPVPDGVPLDEAAFATLGSIALQGVRRSGIRIGECAVVLGLGLIGSLAGQILRAAGARVLGFDPDPGRAALGRALGFEAHDFGARDPREEVPRATGGLLADTVLICAAARGPEVANLAMRLCRKKGRVVIVGDVGLDLDRSLMYEKELDVVISTSYGPGRYDPTYEEQGIDYPAPYVRWTLNRNMAAFLDLLRDARVRVRPLIDRVFPLDEAAAAYEAIDREATGERPVGVLLRYPAAPEAGGADGAISAGSGAAMPESVRVAPPREGLESGASRTLEGLATAGPIGVGVLGAGEFVKAVHLPLLRRHRAFQLRRLATTTPLNARETARRFHIETATTDAQDLLRDPSIDLVLIGTRHDLHAPQVLQALRAGKHVLVEKPLCLDEAEVTPLLDEARRARRLLSVGFNRRYSPLARRAREVLGRLTGPALMVYRVNASRLPASHWQQDPVRGGGRILGECCHFLDLILYLAGADLLAARATAVPSDGIGVVNGDAFAATLDLRDGSRAVLVYGGLGDPGLPKERLEIFKGGAAIVLDDFARLTVHGGAGGSLDLGRQDKGFEGQWEEIGRALRGEPHGVIALHEIEAAMRATFAVARAVRGDR